MVETAEILYGQATNETLAWIYQIMCDNKLKKAYIKQRDIYIDETPICLCPRGNHLKTHPENGIWSSNTKRRSAYSA